MVRKILNFVPGVIVPIGINFVLTFLYASFLEPGQYGILNLYLNTIQIAYAMTSSVFQTASLRYYTIREHYSQDDTFIASFIYGNVFSVILMVPISLIVNFFFSFEWWIIVLSIGANALFQFLCNIYRLSNESKRYNMARCNTAILSVIFLVVFYATVKPLTYIWPLIAVFGSYGLYAISELIRLRSCLHFRLISLPLLIEAVKYGVPLIGVSALGYVVASCDQYFILYFLGEEAVGNYALGHRLVDSLVMSLLSMILLVMTPELNKVYDEKGASLSSVILKKMLNGAIWIIMPISFALIVYADYIVEFVFPEYTAASHIMKLIVLASIFHGLSIFICKGLELVKRPKYVFYALAISTLANILYNAIFIPVYGINAAAHSSLLAYLLDIFLLLLFTKKYYSITFDFRYIAMTTISTMITVLFAVLFMYIIEINCLLVLFCEMICCVLVYLCLSYFFKLFSAFK